MFVSTRSLAAAAATLALIAAAFVSPAAAMQPVPTNHLTATFNPQAQARGGNTTILLGDLASSRYAVVTATNLKGVDGTTLAFNDEASQTRTVLIHNGESVVLDFGSPQNTDNGGSFMVTVGAGTNATNLTLDVLSVGAYVTH